MTDKEYEYWCEQQDVKKPTVQQIRYAEDLLRKLGYDLDDYDLEHMTREEVSELIDELKQEWGSEDIDRNYNWYNECMNG